MIVRGREIGMDTIMELAKIPYYGTHEEKVKGNNNVRKCNYDR